MSLYTGLGTVDRCSTGFLGVDRKPGHEGCKVHNSFLLVKPEIVVQEKE